MKNINQHLSASRSLGYNRLFIIGNGFDLAMGLNSGYNDFMRYYFKELIKGSMRSSGSDLECGIKYNHYRDELFSSGLYKPVSYRKALFDYLLNLDELSFRDFIIEISNHESFKLVPKGEFIEELMNQVTKKNWVDVELTYFNIIYKNRNKKKNVILFNKQIVFFKKKLIEYLEESIKNFTIDDQLKKSMNELFVSELEYEKMKPKTDVRKSHVNKNYFLNFNYTELLNDVIDDEYIDNYKREICNIHGVISDAETDLEKIIFGYGDEDSNKFKELLELNEDEFINNIKTYKYLASRNYDSLNHFINSIEPYQVIIIGHSCQLSDKVLLKEIFTNEKCFSIKIYHFKGSDEFMKKTMSISRITEDPKHLRNRVFRFDEKNTIPQNT